MRVATWAFPLFLLLLNRARGVVEFGLVSFVAVAQFMPGLFGVLFWRRATRAGFIAGLLGGISIWAATLFIPLLARSGLLPSGFDLSHLFGISPDHEPWSISTFASLSINGLLFGGVSLATRPTQAEERAAGAGAKEVLAPEPMGVAAPSPLEFQERLAPLLGPEVAALGGAPALARLEKARKERRPAQLQRHR